MTSLERSLQRYLALALGEEWEIAATGGDQGEVFAPPFARVGPSTPATSSPIGARAIELRQSFSVVCFPVPAVTAEASALEASRVERRLLLALAQGVDEAAFSTRSGRCHPLRVPLYDYADVPLGEPVDPDARAGFARIIEGPDVQAAGDPSSPTTFVVVADFRLSWTQAIGREVPGPVLQSVHPRGEVA